MQITAERTNLPAAQPGFFTGITVRLRGGATLTPEIILIEREGKGDALMLSRGRARRGMTPVFLRGSTAQPLAWVGLPGGWDGPVSEIRWGPDTGGVAAWSDKAGIPGTYTTYDSEHEAYVELGLMFIS